MNCTVTTTIEVDVRKLVENITNEQIVALFDAAANSVVEKMQNYGERRAFAVAFSRGMSENAKRLLAEVFAADYICLTCGNAPEEAVPF